MMVIISNKNDVGVLYLTKCQKITFWTLRHSFWTIFIVFIMDEPIGSFSPVHGESVREGTDFEILES